MGQIEGEDLGLSTGVALNLLSGRLKLAPGPGDQGHVRPVLGQSLCQGQPNTTPRPRDQGRPAGQIEQSALHAA